MEEICTCGCKKTKSSVVREIMRKQMLNEDQADWTFSEAQRIRREQSALN